MVEGARLESVFRGNSNEGSNPSLSAIVAIQVVIPRNLRLSRVSPSKLDGDRAPAARAIQELIKAWKEIRKLGT